MSEQPNIRAVIPEDVPAIKAIAVRTGLFEVDELGDFSDMLNGYLDGSLNAHSWIVLENQVGHVVGAAYYAPEPFSDRMWNLYFIAVLPAYQGRGSGGTLISYVERALRQKGEELARTLIVDTSSLDRFESARNFYRRHGFHEEARIREFYGPDEDKIVFWKSLTVAQ